MKVAFCPNCIREWDIEPVKKPEVFFVRGEPIEVVDAVHYRCVVCGNEIFDMESEERNLRSAYDAYRRKHGLLTPEEIAGIRQRYGLSQRALARALGWGLVTIHRYENGALQDESHDRILREIASDPSVLLKKLEYNKHRFSEDEWKRLYSQIASTVLKSETQSLVAVYEQLQTIAYSIDPVSRGFRAFDFQKVGEIVAWIAGEVGRLYKTKLAKLLWLADFTHFSLEGTSITGLAYVRMPYGPAPDKFQVLLSLLQETGCVDIVTQELGEYSGDLIRPNKTPDLGGLSASEKAVLNAVVRRFGSSTSKELSDLSHGEVLWQSRPDGATLPYTEADQVSVIRELKRSLL
ncbi:MAG: DUF4065 domain-containing protein [Candidatus Fermentithermobacillus carboniphilus]|uniref:DUF4065 domain-containing protein n=1 Tax=Candidatus Fermentithermobacillus carboniphilus TaxID=3085328 RepID=A0AAT9LDH1_9FIRM|nr:MAG: DUF4065 domain-containing protein [Candidatus Fermentithermobacillus carboniphilus]